MNPFSPSVGTECPSSYRSLLREIEWRLATSIVGVALILAGCDQPSLPLAPPSAKSESSSRELAAEVTLIEAREDYLNRTLWAKETRAEECGRVFETLWDQLRTATNRFAVAAEFPAAEIVLGDWQVREKLPHGIILKDSVGRGVTLTHQRWRQWLSELNDAGWALAETEFRHQRFESDSDDRPRQSLYHFSAHLRRTSPVERAILDGDLTVTWGAQSPDGTYPVQRIDASQLEIRTRAGEPPFQLELVERIGSGHQPFAIEPLIVYDLDGDGLSEILLPVSNRVYRRRPDGHYQSSKLCGHPAGPVASAVVADFDGDGRVDLLCAVPQGLILFPGSGAVFFADAGKLVWKANPGLTSPMVLTCGDADSDGDLDIFLGQYKLPYRSGQMPTPYYEANDGDPAYFLLNDGHGHLTDATVAAGLSSKRFRRSLSGSFVDLNEDGFLDLAVVSDFAGLDAYQGDGRGHFTEITGRWFSETHGFGMGHTVADFNADGRLDLFVSGMPSPTVNRLEQMGLWRTNSAEDRVMRARMTHGNRLFLSGAAGRFEQTAVSHSVARSGWSWGCSGFDFDNDGLPDLYIGNGMESRESVRDYEREFWLHDTHVANSEDNPVVDAYLKGKATRLRGRGASYGGYEKNRFFLNRPGKSFTEVAFLLGLSLELDSRSIVADDLDGDGRVDLLVTSFEPWPKPHPTLRVYRNTLQDAGHWIGFRFSETTNQVSPIGTRVVVHAENHHSAGQLLTGDSHASQHANTLHFGLGELEHVDRVEVFGPSGQRASLNSPAIDRYHVVRLPPK